MSQVWGSLTNLPTRFMQTLSVKTVAKALFPFGEYHGVPCLYIAQGEKGLDRELNTSELFNLVMSYTKFRHVWIDAEITQENPDFFQFIVGLAKRGTHKVILRTPANSDVSSFKILRNVSILLIATPPSQNGVPVKLSNWGVLTEGDALIYKIASIEDYEKTLEILKDKNLSRPSVIFHLAKDIKEADYRVLLGKYLSDFRKLGFNSRLVDSKALNAQFENDSFLAVEKPPLMAEIPEGNQTPLDNEQNVPDAVQTNTQDLTESNDGK